jgi:hypothetical protein
VYTTFSQNLGKNKFMKKLSEVIHRGILRGLNENNIELLSDLDDDNLD